MDETNRAIRHVTILGHPQRPQSEPLAGEIASILRGRGVEVWVATQWSEDDAEIAARCAAADAVIAIGGDGAMLRAGRVTSHHAVPVLGVNLGRERRGRGDCRPVGCGHAGLPAPIASAPSRLRAG